MTKRLLFCTGDGIGNVVQCVPTLKNIHSMGYIIDFWYTGGSFPVLKGILPFIDKFFNGNEIKKINANNYVGKVFTNAGKADINNRYINNIPAMNTPVPLKYNRSEVDTYLDIVRDLGVQESYITYDGEINYDTTYHDKHDILLCNGWNSLSGDFWKIKSYPKYNQLAALLIANGFNVASVGLSKEYIPGTINKTNLPLMKSLALIKNSKLLISNDTGLYHCANALKKKNIVIFTATDPRKNYDIRFHKYSNVISRKDLDCVPCQKTVGWNTTCSDWRCQQIPPNDILHIVKDMI